MQAPPVLILLTMTCPSYTAPLRSSGAPLAGRRSPPHGVIGFLLRGKTTRAPGFRQDGLGACLGRTPMNPVPTGTPGRLEATGGDVDLRRPWRADERRPQHRPAGIGVWVRRPARPCFSRGGRRALLRLGRTVGPPRPERYIGRAGQGPVTIRDLIATVARLSEAPPRTRARRPRVSTAPRPGLTA